MPDGAAGRASSPPPPANLDRARLVAAVHRWVSQHGRPPRVIDWDPSLARLRGRPDLADRFEADGGWPSFAKVRRHFGGLRELLRAAGYPPAARRTGRHRREWTASEILTAIRRWSEVYGEPPTMADWDPYRARCAGELWRVERYDSGEWPSVKSVRNQFGRLSHAVAAAGLVPRRQGQRRVPDTPALDVDVLLHVVTVRGLGDMTDPAHRLAQAVRRAAEARGDGEPSDLRVALVELAAVAMDWAATID